MCWCYTTMQCNIWRAQPALCYGKGNAQTIASLLTTLADIVNSSSYQFDSFINKTLGFTIKIQHHALDETKSKASSYRNSVSNKISCIIIAHKMKYINLGNSSKRISLIGTFNNLYLTNKTAKCKADKCQ